VAARKLSGGRPTVWTVTDLRASAPARAFALPAAAGRYGGPQEDRTAPRALALTQIEFAVVDVETTGWSPVEARITEIGAVRLRAGRVTGEFCTLVDPGVPVPADIEELTGISSRLVSTAPRTADALPAWLGFARGCVLAAHNAPFDLGFLMAACGACGLPWPGFPVLDTVAVARQVLVGSEVPDCKLATLAAFFDVPTPPRHRALADARATAAVLDVLLTRLALLGIRTLDDLGEWLAVP
jgi:DNA polymerase III subunit epsilon